MKRLDKQFENRDQLINYVTSIATWAEGSPSTIQGGRKEAAIKLSNIDPVGYTSSRNYGNGKISQLSPYVHHGILSLNEVRNHALTKCDDPDEIIKFIQELSWRDFWQRALSLHPEWAWSDIEPYKTGFTPDDYADELPEDITHGETTVQCLNTFIKELIHTGYIHNHARMYLASYIVHFRRVKWQVGARWFLKHLLDGDVASNNLSWQWVASTFSNKPYIFNLENVHKYFEGLVDTSPHLNQLIDATYDALQARLFPRLKEPS